MLILCLYKYRIVIRTNLEMDSTRIQDDELDELIDKFI